MKKYLIIPLLVLAACVTKAQTKPDTSAVYTAVETQASFPGGVSEFGSFLAKNIRYPADARQKGIQGKVFVMFVVERNGSLSNIKVIRGVSADIDAEAIRVLKISPKWMPGRQSGVAIRQQYTVPISFTLAKK